MIILQDNFKTIINDKTCIALGSFDGLHLGHIGLINKTLELSKGSKMKSMIYTFRNHPLSIIDKNKVPKLIMDNETKLELLNKLGIDIVNLAEFNYEYMKISPENFIFNMHRCYNFKTLVVGYNFRFGYKNSGDTELLRNYSNKLGFDLEVINSVTYHNDVVSSSKIRSLINYGNVEEANKMLLSPFMLKGKVIKGRQLGRMIGFPTANLDYDDNYIIPAVGVYFTIVEFNDKKYKGITSVGFNPTVQKEKSNITIETNILDFARNIYGELIKIYFISRIRNEIKFSSMDALAHQLNKDKKFVQMQNIEKFS